MNPKNIDESPAVIEREEHIPEAGAKRVNIRGLNADDGLYYGIAAVDNGDGTFSLSTSGGSAGATKPTAAYGISNIDSTDSTYKYFGFEDKDGNWYIMRKTLASAAFLYAAGTSGYSTAWTNRSSQTYASFATTF